MRWKNLPGGEGWLDEQVSEVVKVRPPLPPRPKPVTYIHNPIPGGAGLLAVLLAALVAAWMAGLLLAGR